MPIEIGGGGGGSSRLGTSKTLKETVFAGITPAGYANGSTTLIDGSSYTCAVSGGCAVDMVATGLRLRQGTTGTNSFTIAAGATGDNFLSLLGEERFRRGQWAFWSRMASFDFTNSSSSANSAAGNVWVSNTYPTWGFYIQHRSRNTRGTPNTTTGGIAFAHWLGGVDNNAAYPSYPGVTTADVMMCYVRDYQHADVYYGTYSGGWPTMESMTYMGTAMGLINATGTFTKSSTCAAVAASVFLKWEVGGVAASSGTYEVIFDRWRLTTWE